MAFSFNFYLVNFTNNQKGIKHTTETIKIKNATQKTKKMSNTDPTKRTGSETCARER